VVSLDLYGPPFKPFIDFQGFPGCPAPLSLLFFTGLFDISQAASLGVFFSQLFHIPVSLDAVILQIILPAQSF